MSDPASTAAKNLNAAATEFVPSPADAEAAAPPEGDLMEKLEEVADHFHEETFKTFNGNFRNLTLFFPDGLATFDTNERWFVHPWFWSDNVQDFPWYDSLTWRNHQHLRPLKYSCAIFESDNAVLFTGGLTDKLQPSDRCVRARVRFEWGNRSEAIAEVAPLQAARYLHCMVLVGRKLLVLGGQRREEGRMQFLASCESIVNSAWQPAPAMRTPRSTFSAIVHNETVYVFGGFSNCGVLASTAEKLSPAADTWQELAVSCPLLAGVATVYAHNLIWLIGGSDGEHAFGQIFAFDPATEVATELVNEGEPVRLAAPRAKAMAFAVGGNRVFVFGGGVDFGEKFRDMKNESLIYGVPSRVKEDWILACPVSTK